jgi:RNA polymerase sigma-70 factor (ECF subfamily)
VSKGQLKSETICREYFSLIKKIAARRVRDADVDDVVQQALLAIHRSLPSYDPALGNIDSWISCITWRVAGQYLNRQYSEAERQHANADELARSSVADPAPSGEERMMVEEERRFLDAVLARMPEKRRKAFELHVLIGLTQAAVAQILSAPESTVQTWIRTAWEDLDGALQRRRAQERRRGALVLPISVAALIERERARMRDVPAEDFDRAWARVQRRPELEEPRGSEQEIAPEQERSARAPFDPNHLPTELPRRLVDVPSRLRRLTEAAVSGAGGGALVWALLHGDPPPTDPSPTVPSPNVTRLVVGSAIPNAGQMAYPKVGAGAAPWPATPASFAAVPFSVPSAPVSQGGSPRAATPMALPSTSRRAAPDALQPAGSEEIEEILIRTAEEALAAGEIDKARAALDHHAREFPEGRLKVNRNALRGSLPY